MTLTRVQAVREVRKTIWLVVAITLMIAHLQSMSGYTATTGKVERKDDLLSVIEMKEKIDQLSEDLRLAVSALPQEHQEQLGLHPGIESSSVSTTRNMAEGTLFPYHVLFCLSGNETGFLSEFQASLKSVLLNAPVDAPLDIHVVADQKAFDSLENVFETTELSTWQTRNPITIHTYNAEPWLPVWKDKMVKLFKSKYKRSYSTGQSTSKHTIGTMFRLFANDLVPLEVQKMVYLDPDAIIMANLQQLWKQLDADALFQWGINYCAGFMVLDNSKLSEVWELASKSDLLKIANDNGQGANDQLIFLAVNVTYPERVTLLDKAWDINVANGGFRFRKYDKYLKARPEVGMMHFNGGGKSKESAFEVHSFLKDDPYKETWGLVQYYARMPWTWARYWAGSTIPATEHSGHPIRFQVHEPKPPSLSSSKTPETASSEETAASASAVAPINAAAAANASAAE